MKELIPMSKKYVRVSEGLNNYKLVEASKVEAAIKSNDKDYYTSIFLYDQSHYDTWKKTHSLAGVRDVVTNKLFFDFDKENDLERARKDAVVVIERLIADGINPNNIQCAFSGFKGFSVEVEHTALLNPQQFKNIVFSYASDLTTFDTVVNDPNRIIRVTGTKHPKSGLYKFPLTVEQMQNLNVDDIKILAQDINNATEDYSGWTSVTLPTTSLGRAHKETKLETKTVLPILEGTVSELEWMKKPKWLSNCKFAIMNGFVPEGQRNNALMALAATFKAQGFSEEHTVAMLKTTTEKIAAVTGEEEFPENELKRNVVSYVYGPSWKGATYSCKEDGWLKQYCESLGHHKCVHSEKTLVESPKTLLDVTPKFKDFVKNIESNTIKTGIKTLDDNLFITTGMPMAIVGAPGSGKCLGLNTPVLMFDGSIKMVQDIKVGEFLMGDDSTPRKVLSTCTGRETLYKIKQANGDDYIVNESHILSLKGSSSTKEHIKYGKVFDIPLKEYLDKSADFKKRVKGYKVPVEFSKKAIEIDPYIFGVWLGDGTTSKPEFTINIKDEQVLGSIATWASKNNMEARFHQYPSGSDQVFTISIVGKPENSFRNFLKDSNLFEGKYIPTNYLTSSREDRLQLLAGILDTDGYYDTNKNVFILTSSNDLLAKDVVYLLRSLGFKTTLTKCKAHYKSFTKGKLYEGFSDTNDIYITGDNLSEIPTRLVRKQAKKVEKQRYQDLTEISVERLGVGDYYGFEIDGNHRFLLGDFTVTHNTSLALEILNNTSKNDICSVFASLDMTATRIYEKMAYRLTGMTRSDLYNMFREDNEAEYLKLLQKEFGNCFFYDKSSPTVRDLRDYIINCEQESGKKVKLVVVDYFERIFSEHSDDTAASKRVASELQDLVNDLGVCLISLLQPNKMSGDLASPIESYTNIKGSSFIAQSMRMILSVYREGFSPRNPEDDRFITINVLKNDLGETASFDFEWYGKRGFIKEIDSYSQELLDQIRARKQAEDKLNF